MRTLTFFFATVAAVTVAAACSKSEPKAGASAAAHQVASATVDELDGWLAAGQCTAVDANGDGTRKKLGTVPGATLLSEYDTYPISQLPPDKQRRLVFYCANEQCGASHEAAARAITAGYKDVRVLPAGIAGWVKAGKKVATL
ncbi:MAG: hypothetical protein KBG28_05210 [Kofleriaceae bacterium]|jgi:rhodanese-related sulfurtransferase|nr:hypothetical protein [Kofleriaceae bacterium]MBP6835906.1 hypothetical protein [Kofleriaceae bacterium]MBP9203343.1 hypothetical protein [Kofleriaceae bacterium]